MLAKKNFAQRKTFRQVFDLENVENFLKYERETEKSESWMNSSAKWVSQQRGKK